MKKALEDQLREMKEGMHDAECDYFSAWKKAKAAHTWKEAHKLYGKFRACSIVRGDLDEIWVNGCFFSEAAQRSKMRALARRYHRKSLAYYEWIIRSRERRKYKIAHIFEGARGIYRYAVDYIDWILA